MNEMKLYKVIRKNQSCHGGSFDWSKHLPKGSRPGKWTPKIKAIEECWTGYHVTPYWNMWFDHEDCEVYECETKGLVKKSAIGVIDKFVCESVRLTKKLELDFGGDRNTGDRNTGDWNTGNCNTGDWNTGDRNTGDWNTGYRNTGDRNTGDCNTGDCNTGDWNTGDCNTGNRNTGDWNTGDSNTGAFNTGKPRYYDLFNKPISAEEYRNIQWPNYFYFDLENDKTYQECFRAAFATASAEEIKATIGLPNFDYEVFEEVSGISKSMIEEKLGK